MSADTKFTPGPWWVDGNQIFKDYGDTRYLVATLEHWDGDNNAALIAAAPDLYVRLEQAILLIDSLVKPTWTACDEFVQAAKQDLAKARGEA